MCVRVGVCGRNTLNQTVTVCHHPRLISSVSCLCFFVLEMSVDVSGFFGAKVCVNVLPCTLARAACACMHVRAYVCVFTLSLCA